MLPRLSSICSMILDRCEAGLDRAGHDRLPWLAVAMFAGIATWLGLKTPFEWIGCLVAVIVVAAWAALAWRHKRDRFHLRNACMAIGFMFALGLALVWARSELVGATAIEHPRFERLEGYVLERQDQPARDRSRLTLAIRDSETGEAMKIRVNSALLEPEAEVREGAIVRLEARLMPPAAPMVPGGYDFARVAWFEGLAATGRVTGEVEIVASATAEQPLAAVQRQLSVKVRSHIQGSAGAIAATLASGDRGAITQSDQNAMRDAGLTHLLAISGLHVSAVIGAAYLITLKLLGLVPFLALRMRLPLAAAIAGACAGLGYTLLTGAQVPTVRSCVAAMLVLLALAMGRDPLSMRMVGFAAIVVMLLWPESIIGPSFQMSFAAVLAIVALHSSAPVKAFLAPREESWARRSIRIVAMLFVTGLVIEIALMPIVLFHFHRAGLYGAAANVLAIPLVTFVAMPSLAIGLALETIGLGGPFLRLTEQAVNLLLAIAHFTAQLPGSVKLLPQMSVWTLLLFTTGGLWLALWRGNSRLLGLAPVGLASILIATTSSPDILIARDGRHVGVRLGNGDLLTLQASLSDYAQSNLLEHAGVSSDPIPIAYWQDAKCSPEFCTIELQRDERDWILLLARNRVQVEERALAAACERADVVVADRWLPRSCRPRWLKVDRALLSETGGLAIHLKSGQIKTVAEGQGSHGWWRPSNPPKKESAAPSRR
jgi:competence protein ComEC